MSFLGSEIKKIPLLDNIVKKNIYLRLEMLPEFLRSL